MCLSCVNDLQGVGVEHNEAAIIASHSHQTQLLRTVEASDGGVLVLRPLLVCVDERQVKPERVEKLDAAIEGRHHQANVLEVLDATSLH